MILNGLYSNTLAIEKTLREITQSAKLSTILGIYNLSRLNGPTEQFQEQYVPEEIEEKHRAQGELRVDSDLASVASLSALGSPNSTSWGQKQQLES